jgi:hypothetical protein
MIRKFIILFITCALHATLYAQHIPTQIRSKQRSALNTLNKTQNTFLPQIYLKYYWDESSNEWYPEDSAFMEYDAKGNVSQVVAGNHKTKWIHKYTYDHNNKLTSEISLSWLVELNIIDSSKQTFITYNTLGNPVQLTDYWYDININKWNINYKDSFIYDSANLPLEEISYWWSEDLNVFTQMDKKSYVYDNQCKPMEITYMVWDGASNAYKVLEQLTDLTFHQWPPIELFDIKATSYIQTSWMDGWSYQRKKRYTSSFDAHHNQTEFGEELWTGANWELQFKQRTLYTYDENGTLTQYIEQDYDANAAEYINGIKYVYSSFVPVNPINQVASVKPDFTIYPNPLTDESVIRINQLSTSDTYKLNIYNNVGTLASTQTINNGEAKIEKETLNPGLYFYQLTKNNQPISKGRLQVQ